MDRGRVIGVVVVAVGLLGGWLLLRDGGLLRGPDVVLFGDSITFLAADTFTERIGDDWDLTVSGIPGARADERVAQVAELAAGDPVQVVINLGTNDVMQGKPPAETEAALDQLGQGFAHARCVHLVTVSENMFIQTDGGVRDRAAELNGRIRDLASRRGWKVVPWAELVAGYEAGPQPDGPLTTDTVHPTEMGERILADAYERSLDSC